MFSTWYSYYFGHGGCDDADFDLLLCTRRVVEEDYHNHPQTLQVFSKCFGDDDSVIN